MSNFQPGLLEGRTPASNNAFVENLVNQLSGVIFSEGAARAGNSALPEHDANDYFLDQLGDSRPVLIGRTALEGRTYTLRDETGVPVEAHKVLGMEVRSPVIAPRSTAARFSFYKLNPERFETVMFGRSIISSIFLNGRIPRAANYFVTGGYRVIDKPARNPLLREVQATFPVDAEKYANKRERIAKDLGINIVPYAAAA